MNHCKNCGTDFEGNFCPGCGACWEEGKICPQCGASLAKGANFCSECGYSFLEGKPTAAAHPEMDSEPKKEEVPARRPGGSSSVKYILFRSLRCLPELLFLLFAALTFAFLAAPVTKTKPNLFMTVIDVGNAYKAAGLKDVPGLRDPAIAFIVFAALQAAFSPLSLLTRHNRKFRAVYSGFAFDLIFLIIASVMAANVAALDEGLGILSAGACPILMIVFPILLAAGNIAALVVAEKLSRDPEVVEAEKERTQKKAARRDAYYASHSAPVCPETADKAARAKYKQEKYIYDHALERSPSKTLIWIDVHRALLTFCALVLAVAIVLITVLVPVLSNKFRIGVVKKIEIGATKEEVAKVLGEPYGDRDTNLWEYYDKSLLSYVKKADELEKKSEEAMMNGDLDKFGQLQNQYENLMNEVNSKRFSYIEVTFAENDGQVGVTSVLLDKAYSSEPTEKQIKQDQMFYTGEEKTITELFYLDYREAGAKKILKDSTQKNSFYYVTQFKDGSYYCSSLDNFSTYRTKDITKYQWTDKYGTHTVDPPENVKIREQTIGMVDSNGTWSSSNVTSLSYDIIITSIEIPDGVTAIESLGFYCFPLLDHNPCVSVTIPDSVVEIQEWAFDLCDDLKNITVAEGNRYYSSQDSILYNKNKTELIFVPPKIDGMITIPDSVTSIGNSAFYGRDGLTSITIGNGVASIGRSAFSGCSSLESVTFGSGLTMIQAFAFSGCSALTSAVFTNPNGWTVNGTVLNGLEDAATAIPYLLSGDLWKRS